MGKMDLAKRKRNRINGFRYNDIGGYFITVCTKDRQCILWNAAYVAGENVGLRQYPPLNKYGTVVDDAIKLINHHYPSVTVDHYIIMPNHIHLLLQIRNTNSNIGAPAIMTVVQQFKGYVTKKIGKSIWQRSFHDHVVRNQKDYNRIAKYIYNNPITWKYDVLNPNRTEPPSKDFFDTMP